MVRAAGLLLVAVVVALTQPGEAQWRPNYQPATLAYSVVNNSLDFSFIYSQWQGYFNNTWTLPAGAHSAPERQCSAACMLVRGLLELQSCCTCMRRLRHA